MATKRVNVWNLDIYLPDDVESNEVDSVQVWCASCEIDGSIVRESFVSAASINQLGHKAGGRIGKGIVAIVLEDAVITGSIHGAMETVGGTPKTVQHRLRSLKQAAVDGEAQAVPLEGEGEAPAEAPTSEANEAEAETPTADAEAEAEAEGESSALDVNNNQGAQNGACDMSINNQVTSFSRCFPVDSIAKGFVIGYTVEQDPANNGASLIKMGMRAPQNGYVSVGFPSNPGKMIGATAMILKSCQNCAASADLYEVYMTAEDLNGVNPANLLNSTDIQVSVDKSTGEMLGSFVMSWPGKVPRRRLLQAFVKDKALNDFPVIFAAGPVSSSDVALEHSTHGASSLDLTSTTTQISVEAGLSGTVKAHMWLMTIGWGFLLPLGVLLARMLKVDESNSLPTKNDSSVSGAITKGDDLEDLKSQNISNKPQKVAIWFQTHRAIQTLGFVLGVVGFALGFVENGGWDSEEEVVETHRNLGIATAVLMVIQMTALLWRPAKDHKVRKPWSLWHVWVGRVIIVLIIANIYYGMTKVEVLDTWTWATYTAVLAVMLLVALFDQFYLKRRSK